LVGGGQGPHVWLRPAEPSQRRPAAAAAAADDQHLPDVQRVDEDGGAVPEVRRRRLRELQLSARRDHGLFDVQGHGGGGTVTAPEAPRCPNCACCLRSVCEEAARVGRTCIEVDASEPRHLGCLCSYQWERLR
jgi:hypothetical protein